MTDWLFGLRLGCWNWFGRKRRYSLAAPWLAPTFSERFGYEVPKVKMLGWRLFVDRRPDA